MTTLLALCSYFPTYLFSHIPVLHHTWLHALSLSLQAASAPAEVDDTVPVDDVAPAPQQCGCTSYCHELLPGQKPSMPFQVSCYGARLQRNKAALAEACAAAGVGPDMHALLVAMAMIETNHMCPT